MRRNITKIFLATVLFILILVGGYSCTKDDTLTELEVRRMIEEALMNYSSDTDDALTELEVRRMIEEALKENNANLKFTQLKIVNIQVKQTDWQWNDQERLYQAIYPLPELTESIYNGLVLGSLFLGQQGVDEVQKMLPYVFTYYLTDTGGNITQTFTETISYDVMYQSEGNSNVAFFIQESDVYEDPVAPQTYNFRLVLIW